MRALQERVTSFRKHCFGSVKGCGTARQQIGWISVEQKELVF